MDLTRNESNTLVEDYMVKIGYDDKWEAKDTIFAILSGGIYNPVTKVFVDGVKIGVGLTKEIIAKN